MSSLTTATGVSLMRTLPMVSHIVTRGFTYCIFYTQYGSASGALAQMMLNCGLTKAIKEASAYKKLKICYA